MRDNDLCNFCQIEEESLIHLFWNCTVTSCFWHNFRQWLPKNETSLLSLELTPYLVIGLKTPHYFAKSKKQNVFWQSRKTLYLENTKDSEDLKVYVFYCLTNHGSWGGCMYVNSIII